MDGPGGNEIDFTGFNPHRIEELFDFSGGDRLTQIILRKRSFETEAELAVFSRVDNIPALCFSERFSVPPAGRAVVGVDLY